MEGLSLEDPAEKSVLQQQQQQPNQQQQQNLDLGPAGFMPSQPAQLPPQMFTTAAQLLDLTDKKLMVSLRDGRKLIGVLRSWDQFANLVLQSTVERIFVPPSTPPSISSLDPSAQPTPQQPGLYADVPCGTFLVRGENVLLLGEIDLDKEDDTPRGYELADVDVVRKLIKENKARDAKRDKTRLRKLGDLGFEGENSGEVLI